MGNGSQRGAQVDCGAALVSSEDTHLRTLEHLHQALEFLTYAMLEQSGVNQQLTTGLNIVSGRGIIQPDELAAILSSNSKMLGFLKQAINQLNDLAGIIDES